MKKPSNRLDAGWVTLELVLALPTIVAIIALVFFVSRLGFVRLHLTYIVNQNARIAANQGCAGVESRIRASFSNSPHFKDISCIDDEIVTISAEYTVLTGLSFLSALDQDVKVTAHALKEERI